MDDSGGNEPAEAEFEPPEAEKEREEGLRISSNLPCKFRLEKLPAVGKSEWLAGELDRDALKDASDLYVDPLSL